MCRECRERFPRHRLQRKPIVSDPGMHHCTCVTHMPWCLSGSLTRCGGDNLPGIPVACATLYNHDVTQIALRSVKLAGCSILDIGHSNVQCPISNIRLTSRSYCTKPVHGCWGCNVDGTIGHLYTCTYNWIMWDKIITYCLYNTVEWLLTIFYFFSDSDTHN